MYTHLHTFTRLTGLLVDLRAPHTFTATRGYTLRLGLRYFTGYVYVTFALLHLPFTHTFICYPRYTIRALPRLHTFTFIYLFTLHLLLHLRIYLCCCTLHSRWFFYMPRCYLPRYCLCIYIYICCVYVYGYARYVRLFVYAITLPDYTVIIYVRITVRAFTVYTRWLRWITVCICYVYVATRCLCVRLLIALLRLFTTFDFTITFFRFSWSRCVTRCCTLHRSFALHGYFTPVVRFRYVRTLLRLRCYGLRSALHFTRTFDLVIYRLIAGYIYTRLGAFDLPAVAFAYVLHPHVWFCYARLRLRYCVTVYAFVVVVGLFPARWVRFITRSATFTFDSRYVDCILRLLRTLICVVVGCCLIHHVTRLRYVTFSFPLFRWCCERFVSAILHHVAIDCCPFTLRSLHEFCVTRFVVRFCVLRYLVPLICVCSLPFAFLFVCCPLRVCVVARFVTFAFTFVLRLRCCCWLPLLHVLRLHVDFVALLRCYRFTFTLYVLLLLPVTHYTFCTFPLIRCDSLHVYVCGCYTVDADSITRIRWFRNVDCAATRYTIFDVLRARFDYILFTTFDFAHPTRCCYALLRTHVTLRLVPFWITRWLRFTRILTLPQLITLHVWICCLRLRSWFWRLRCCYVSRWFTHLIYDFILRVSTVALIYGVTLVWLRVYVCNFTRSHVCVHTLRWITFVTFVAWLIGYYAVRVLLRLRFVWFCTFAVLPLRFTVYARFALPARVCVTIFAAFSLPRSFDTHTHTFVRWFTFVTRTGYRVPCLHTVTHHLLRRVYYTFALRYPRLHILHCLRLHVTTTCTRSFCRLLLRVWVAVWLLLRYVEFYVADLFVLPFTIVWLLRYVSFVTDLLRLRCILHVLLFVWFYVTRCVVATVTVRCVARYGAGFWFAVTGTICYVTRRRYLPDFARLHLRCLPFTLLITFDCRLRCAFAFVDWFTVCYAFTHVLVTFATLIDYRLPLRLRCRWLIGIVYARDYTFWLITFTHVVVTIVCSTFTLHTRLRCCRLRLPRVCRVLLLRLRFVVTCWVAVPQLRVTFTRCFVTLRLRLVTFVTARTPLFHRLPRLQLRWIAARARCSFTALHVTVTFLHVYRLLPHFTHTRSDYGYVWIAVTLRFAVAVLPIGRLYPSSFAPLPVDLRLRVRTLRLLPGSVALRSSPLLRVRLRLRCTVTHTRTFTGFGYYVAALRYGFVTRLRCLYHTAVSGRLRSPTHLFTRLPFLHVTFVVPRLPAFAVWFAVTGCDLEQLRYVIAVTLRCRFIRLRLPLIWLFTFAFACHVCVVRIYRITRLLLHAFALFTVCSRLLVRWYVYFTGCCVYVTFAFVRFVTFCSTFTRLIDWFCPALLRLHVYATFAILLPRSSHVSRGCVCPHTLFVTVYVVAHVCYVCTLHPVAFCWCVCWLHAPYVGCVCLLLITQLIACTVTFALHAFYVSVYGTRRLRCWLLHAVTFVGWFDCY